MILEFIYSSESQDKLRIKRHVANMLKTGLEDLEREIERVLKYVSGWKRKTSNYPNWKRQQKYRESLRESGNKD